MSGLSTNGLTLAPGFPVTAYDATHEAVVSRWAKNSLYEHFSGSWNAVAYRFRGALDAGRAFDRSLAEFGSAPAPEERYLQERALFDFFSNGFAAFEAGFYAAFVIGALLDPAKFPLATPRDQQRVSPTQTSDAYKRAFPHSPIVGTISELFSDTAYQQWREVRNILTHRAAPGRVIYASIGSDEELPAEWKLNNIVLDQRMVPVRQDELARLLTKLIVGIHSFVTE